MRAAQTLPRAAEGGLLFSQGIPSAAKGAGNESLTVSRFDGEAVAFAFDNIEQQLGIGHQGCLADAGIERRTLNLPEQNIERAKRELALFHANRRSAVTATAR